MTVVNDIDYASVGAVPTGGVTGQLVALPQPNTLPGGGGLLCREFERGGFGYNLGSVIGGFGGSENPVVVTRKYVLEADVLLETADLGWVWGGIGMKMGQLLSPNRLPPGYWLIIGSNEDSYATPNLRLMTKAPAQNDESIHASIHAVAVDTWYRFRLEMIPGVNEDTLRAYSFNGTTFDFEYEVTVPNVIPPLDHVPYGDSNGNVGFGFGSGQRVGGPTPSVFFDNIKGSIETI